MNKNQTHIIAEMACSHEGDLDLARQIIDGAGKGGANAIQFQIWSLPDMVVPHHPEYNKLKIIEMSWQEWEELAGYVRERYPSMEIIACIYEQRSLEFCEKVNVDAYKLHSSDLSNPFLVKAVANTGKRIDLSIGGSDLIEIQTAIGWIHDTSESKIWLMYGYQDFPTLTRDVHLRYLEKIKSLFGLPVGYQDHSDADTDAAFWLPASAIGIGVNILEKHITHDRSLKGIDHEAALNPDEFARFVQMVRTIGEAMGISVPKPFSKEELRYRKYSKKSLVAAHDLEAGTIICDQDLTFMRADSLGLPPDQIWRLAGKKLNKPISRYHLIREEDVS